MTKSKKLLNLFSSHKLIRVMGAHNALSAKLVEKSGFDAVWASGLEISTSYALPDANILTMTDFFNVASSMNEAVNIPVIADCDTGYGNSNNVIHLVKKYEVAEIATVCIEDKLFPKVNSFIPGRQELASIAEFVGKILAAKNALFSDLLQEIINSDFPVYGMEANSGWLEIHSFEDYKLACSIIK
jgi:phosphoenolpyruvate phosphomutase